MVLKKDQTPRLCCDATTTRKSTDIITNQVVPVRHEAPITFGKVKQKLYQYLLHKNQSSLSHDTPSQGQHKDLYNLATDMVFGTTALASSWEPFWRAIELLSEVFPNRPDLVLKHKKFLTW